MPEARDVRTLPTRAQADWVARVLGLRPSGQSAPSSTAPAPDSAGFARRLAIVVGALKDALAAALPTAVDAKLKVSEAGVFGRKQDFVRAHALLDEAEALLAAPQGEPPSEQESEAAEDEGPAAPPPNLPPELLSAPPRAVTLKGMAAWQAARANAISTLSRLEDAFREMAHPASEKGIILLRAIRANLTERPETPQQVAELERYVTTDDIIMEAEVPNGFGFVVALRTPLLAALASLREEQIASAGATP